MDNVKHIHNKLPPELFIQKVDWSKVKNMMCAFTNENNDVEIYVSADNFIAKWWMLGSLIDYHMTQIIAINRFTSMEDE